MGDAETWEWGPAGEGGRAEWPDRYWGERQQETEWAETLTRGRQSATERLRKRKERQWVLWCLSSVWQLDTTNQTKKWRQVTRQPSPGSLPVWLLPIGYSALKPYFFIVAVISWSTLNENRPLLTFLLILFFKVRCCWLKWNSVLLGTQRDVL